MTEFVADPVRHPPELMRYFRAQQQRWREGKVRLVDYAEAWMELDNGDRRPLWYPQPLGLTVIPDKAELFEAIGYRPSLPACYAHASLAKVRVYSGGARAGKSRWAGMELAPILLSPNTRTWLVAPEYEQGRKEFEYLCEVIETDHVRKLWAPQLAGGKIRNNPKNGDMVISLDWGDAGESFVKVKSAQIPRSLLSEELDAVCVVEASQIPGNIWSRFLQMRLSTRRGIAIFPSTPDGLGWFSELFLAGLSGEPGFFSINADSRMNPTLDLDELAFWSSPAHMSDEDFDEQVRGRPTPKHGRVYRTFDPQVHVQSWQREWPLPTWKRGRGFDFGYVDPYVVLWIARDAEGRFYVYRELYRTQMLTDDVVKEIARIEGWPTERDERGGLRLAGTPIERMDLASCADWDASERADLWRRGVRTRKAKKDILPGIRTVTELLRLQGDGRPRLYISPACRNLIRELGTYAWGPHEEPLDQDNHAPDALRYFCHTLAPAAGKLLAGHL